MIENLQNCKFILKIFQEKTTANGEVAWPKVLKPQNFIITTYVCTLLFLNHNCMIIIEGGQASFALLVLAFDIAKLCFWFCCNVSFEILTFVIVF
jgi:hypothetical protein